MSDSDHSKTDPQNVRSRILYLFTRTPLHIGAGASVGAIDQPIQRERHTGFPIIPATGQKGSFADQWPTPLRNEKDEAVRVVEESKNKGKRAEEVSKLRKGADPEGKEADVTFLLHSSAWLFGSDTTDLPFAGSLIFSEARVLAFPIRSAKGSYAWITCPLMLQRAARDGVFGKLKKDGDGEETNQALASLIALKEPADEEAIFQPADPNNKDKGKLDVGGQIVLEEYCFKSSTQSYPTDLATAISKLIADELFQSIADRLVILSNGMMSHFATTACEIAQHVRISDETGTADSGGLFNQENVPADTLFYAILSAVKSRVPGDVVKYQPDKEKEGTSDAAAALAAFEAKVKEVKAFQFGGDATTGLGLCSVTLNKAKTS